MNDAAPAALSRRPWRTAENALVALALGAQMILPLAEIVLRRTLHVGISGSASLVQHLTLVIGMLGGALAARDGRLLSLSTADQLFSERGRRVARVVANGVGAAISVGLCVAAFGFVLSEKEAGKILVYHVPLWTVQCVMPLGFAAVAWRLCWRAGSGAADRALAILLAIALLAVARWTPGSPEHLMLPAFAVLLAATVLGAPVFVMLGGAALILFWGHGEPTTSIAVDHYRLVTNPSLPAIPLFTLAGYFLAEGGASRRLIRVFQTLVGQFRGGPALVTVMGCAFFTSFTGASGVTILALGGLLMPVLLAAKYSERSALGLLTGAGSLGLLFPPCLPLILYAIISTQAHAPITIREIFLAGILPGILLVAMTGWWGILQGPKDRASRPTFHPSEAGRAIWAAKWELLLPVVALVGLFGGWATPVEAAAVTALYAFFIETVVYRDLRFRGGRREVGDVRTVDESGASPANLLGVMSECGLLIGGVLLILGVALGFTNYLVDAEIPARLVTWVTASIHSPWMFLLLLNLFLLVVGCLMDIYSAIVVVVPLIVPIGRAFGIEPVHLGIIFLANLELGFLTPPVGMNLFLSSYRFNKPMAEVTRAIIPILLVLLVGVLLITYFPPLTTALPHRFGR